MWYPSLGLISYVGIGLVVLIALLILLAWRALDKDERIKP